MHRYRPHQRVIAVVSGKAVKARAAVEQVIAVAAAERIGAGTAIELVGARSP